MIVPMFFSDDLNRYDLNTKQLSEVALNPGRQETMAQKGNVSSMTLLFVFRIGSPVMDVIPEMHVQME